MKKIIKRSLIVMAGVLGVCILGFVIIMSRELKHHDSLTEGGTGIARQVEASSFQREIDQKGLEKGRDARSADISGLQIDGLVWEEPYLDFDTDTLWPEKLPAGYEPDAILELGKNPGLGIRKLHDRGIDGRGVSIAIIDQTLMTEHEEYGDNLVHYEEMYVSGDQAQMHGSAVSSIAVGRNVGVAPGSKLYYIAADVVDNYLTGKINYEYYANAINRLLELNQTLAPEERIRAISISKGFTMDEKNADKLLEAIERAKAENILVVTTSMEQYSDYKVGGLGKADIMGDPDSLENYTIGYFEKKAVEYFKDSLLVPMDGRTFAGFTGAKDYEWMYSGGLSWTCPYVAGLYALAAQVRPDITPDEFMEACYQTADSKEIEVDGQEYILNYIINPEGMIAKLQSE